MQALHDAALRFVVAPLPDDDGNVVVRLDERYSMVVHPFLDGRNPGTFAGYDTAADRSAVLTLLVELHAATEIAAPHAAVDDLLLPNRDALEAALAHLGTRWDAGPYGERARTLLAADQAGLRALLVAYEELAVPVRREPERFVLTHGEPHAGNVFVVDGRHRLIDWDTALVAPPERDLWVLDPGDGSILEDYRRATGVSARPDVLDLYRLSFDLDEIGGYLEALRQPHGDDANTVQMWTSLVTDLRLDARWSGCSLRSGHRGPTSGLRSTS